MEEVRLDDGRERQLRIFFEDNYGEVEDEIYILHEKR